MTNRLFEEKKQSL